MPQAAFHRLPVNGSHNKHWKASDKQRALLLKLVENSGIEIEVVEAISKQISGHPPIEAFRACTAPLC